MKTYLYNELGQSNPIRITEEEILKRYWVYWKSRMEDVGLDNLISKEMCISDWITVHWAWEEKD